MITSDIGPWGIVPRALIADMAGNTTAIAVYALLSSYADRRGDDGWSMSRKRIAEEAGIAVSTAEKALRRLAEAGWVDKVPMSSPDGTQGWNRYIVHVTRGEVVRGYEGGRIERGARSYVDTSPNQTPLQTNEQTSTLVLLQPSVERRRGKATDWTSELFDQFWQSYPRKVGKPAALRAFRKSILAHGFEGVGQTLQDIAVGLERWRIYWESRDEPEFIPHPSTWLNQERWNDAPPRTTKKEPPGMAAIRRMLDTPEVIDVDGA